MRELKRWQRGMALGAVLALTAAGCGDDGDEGTDDTDTSSEDTGSDAGDDGEASDMAVSDVATDVGVTEEPCPGTPNQDNGCIYLGVISDFTGPFSVFGQPLTDANRAFWDKVNEDGGIGGLFDVVITDENVGDSGYNPATHAQEFARIEPNVLALAQTLGTAQTLGIAGDMADLDMVGAVATWWSGWEFNENVIQYGSNYCLDAANGVDYLVGNPGATVGEAGEEVVLPESIDSMIVVYFPGDYGGDALAGVQAAAEANGISVTAIEQVPVAAGGDVAGAVAQIVGSAPDAVWITTGPSELGQIVGGSVVNGYQGMFMGSHPTFNPALLASEAAPLILTKYLFVGPTEGFDGASAAHEALRASAASTPSNDGYTFGWMMEYPLLAGLEAAVAEGDLTRAALKSALESATVTFDGALPDKTYGGEPSETVVRETVIGKASAGATLGSATVEAGFSGATASGYDFSSPCVSLG